MCSKYYIFLAILTCILLQIAETGVPLQLVPFRETAHAVRLVPNTLELNEFIDRTLQSVKILSEVENMDSLPIDSAYKYFLHQTPGKSVPVVFRTSQGVLHGFTYLVRSGNAYIYDNKEDSIQVVAKFVSDPLRISYKQYNLTGELKESGAVAGTVDSCLVDVRLTLRARQNNSRAPVYVCDGKVDELTLTSGNIEFELTGELDQEVYTTILNVLSEHFDTNISHRLSKFLASSLETVVRRDDQLCYSLVLCNSCEFYTSDS